MIDKWYILSDFYQLGIEGCVFGLSSSLSLAIILILTSIIVRHDPPVRVVFHQCLYGFLISLFILLFSVSELSVFDFSSFDFKNAIIEAVLYVTGVICLLQALYYAPLIVVALSSYSLYFYSIFFDTIIDGNMINIQTAVSAALIAVGSGILIHSSYKKDKNKRI